MGLYGQGRGEDRDAIEALGFLSSCESVDSDRLGIAGYSFGAEIALRSCSNNNMIKGVVSVACPRESFVRLSRENNTVPKLLLCGDQDQYVSISEFKSISEHFLMPKQVIIVSGANHFSEAKNTKLR